MRQFVPAEFQPSFPLSRFLLAEHPRPDAVAFDVAIVGGGPAGLACAIELARLAKENGRHIDIAVLEKGSELGNHSLSGAIVDPGPFRALFPGLADSEFPFRKPVMQDRVYLLNEYGRVRIPTPPTMRNDGHFVASICEIVRWMGQKASELGVSIFPSFPVDSLLVDKNQVIGLRTTPSGLSREGNPLPGARPPSDLKANVTVLAEGARGALTQAYFRWQKISSPAPQIYALGVKELWETKAVPNAVIHTMGWPLPNDVFGGSFLYPMGEHLVALGLVVGLDYKDVRLDVHELLQQLKTHPLFYQYLKGGEISEWGAKIIPEGGFYSLPERLSGDGLMVLGDSAGFVNVAALKGIHYAVMSGMLGARALFEAIRVEDYSGYRLSSYDRSVRESFVVRDLWETRNMRLAFKSGLVQGGLKAGIMNFSPRAFPPGRDRIHPDAAEARFFDEQRQVDTPIGLSKADAVYRSGNVTRDDIPNHLLTREYIPPEVGLFYEHMCPAGVYEYRDGRLLIHAANCIDCKTTDVLGPRWTPREGGSGPRYRRM